MIKLISTLLILIAALQPVLAQELYGYYGYSNFLIQGSKAYSSTTTYDENYIETRVIEQYDFPSLNFQNSMTLKAGEGSYFSSIQVEDNGILVSQTQYAYDYVDNDDGSTTVTYTDTITRTAYDLSFAKQGEKVTEDTYSYTSYPYYYDGYDCPDTKVAREVKAKVLAKKKGGGKKGGGTTSCSKVKLLKSKVIK
jgi:hypothetical protein